MTAKEFLSKKDNESGTMWTEDDDGIIEAFKEFAEIHVKLALEAALNSIDDGYIHFSYKDDILNAYSKQDIL